MKKFLSPSQVFTVSSNLVLTGKRNDLRSLK